LHHQLLRSRVTPQIRKPSTLFFPFGLAFCRHVSFEACCVPRISNQNSTHRSSQKDGGALRTIREACDYTAAIGKEREMCRRWQQVCRLTLDEAHIAAVSWQLRLALVKDAKLDVTARHA
jgi:hypothetical protein